METNWPAWQPTTLLGEQLKIPNTTMLGLKDNPNRESLQSMDAAACLTFWRNVVIIPSLARTAIAIQSKSGSSTSNKSRSTCGLTVRTMPKYVVRCGAMRTLHVLQARDKFLRGNRVVCRTPRGLEFGEVLAEATPEAIDKLNDPPAGSIQRLASEQDENELLRITGMARTEFEACKRIIGELGMAMDLVDLEHLLGGERVVVYYISEDRIDFRELVKRLATEFQTRIEMKQIGVRDEAKLLADYGDCGKPVCCNTHLHQMPPVSMKMAKLQKATLDPSKISGRCGRLKCCLRYEYDTYEEIARDMPPPGSDIVTNKGRGRVLGQEILAKQLLVQMEDDRRILIALEDVLTVLRKSPRSKPQRDKEEGDENGVEGTTSPIETRTPAADGNDDRRGMHEREE